MVAHPEAHNLLRGGVVQRSVCMIMTMDVGGRSPHYIQVRLSSQHPALQDEFRVTTAKA